MQKLWIQLGANKGKDNVTLTGLVFSEVERMTAEHAAQFVATFFELDDELRV
jgi:hypothetical protein